MLIMKNNNGLPNNVFNAFIWSFIDKVGLQGIQFVISIVLARLLLPEQYGLIGMLAIFLGVAQSFLDSGFGSALIHKINADYVDECSIFYFNIVVGLLATGLLYLVAPAIAQFYKEPLLEPLTRFLSLNIFISSFCLIQTTILTKRLDFKTQAKISISTVVITGPIGIALAYKGYGVWSLAIQQVAGSLARSILLWVFCIWRPSLTFSFSALRGLFSYGSRLLASSLLDKIFENLYLVIIGKFFSAASLGYYSRSLSLQQLPASTLTDIVSRVTFPLFSSMQYDSEQLKKEFRKTFTALAYINLPIFVGLTLVAKPLVIVLLTDKWLPSVLYLQLLAVLGAMYPLHAIHLNLLKSKGRSDLFLKLEVLKKILVVINIVITWSHGIGAMIIGQVVITIVAYFINSYYTTILIKYSFAEQFRDLAPIALISAVMGASVGLISYYVSISSNYFMLFMQVSTGFIFYILLSWLFKPDPYRMILGLIKNKLFQNG